MQISGEPLAEDDAARSRGLQPRSPAAEHLLRSVRSQAQARLDRSAGLLDGRRVVRVLEAADEQGRARVGRGDLARVRSARERRRRVGGAQRSDLAAMVQHFAAGLNALGSVRLPGGHVPANPNALLGTRGERQSEPDGHGQAARRTRSAGPASGRRRTSFASFDPDDRSDGRRSISSARSAPTTIPARRARSRARTTSATTRRCTCAIARRRSTRRSRPGADGFSAWKYGLWVLNYLQVMHDSTEAAVVDASPIRISRASAWRATRSSAPTTRAPTAVGHVPRLERHRGLPGADVHRRGRQPRRGLARCT